MRKANSSSRASNPPSKASVMTFAGFLAMMLISFKSKLPVGGATGRTNTCKTQQAYFKSRFQCFENSYGKVRRSDYSGECKRFVSGHPSQNSLDTQAVVVPTLEKLYLNLKKRLCGLPFRKFQRICLRSSKSRLNLERFLSCRALLISKL